MTLNEIFQTLKFLSKADLNSVKEYLESLELNFNGFEDFLLTKKSEKGINCPHCNSFNFKKNGHKGIIQRFLCKDCHKTFTSRNHTITFSSKKSFSVWKKYIDCMMNGFTVRKSAEICGINKDTAFIWRHKILDALHKAFDNRIVSNSLLCTDDMNSYVDLAKTNELELIQLKTGKSKLGIYHIQYINSYHSMLKNFINRFHGVATKYLNNYLVWHNFLNHAKESYAEKTTIFADFVFTTEKVDLSKSIPLRPALPLVA